MAAGRAVVATEVGSIAAAVEHGRTGLLVPRQDRAALGAALIKVLGDPAFCRELGARGRARANERFRLDLCLDETERFLAMLAARAQP